jgi:hypothetical protein
MNYYDIISEKNKSVTVYDVTLDVTKCNKVNTDSDYVIYTPIKETSITMLLPEFKYLSLYPLFKNITIHNLTPVIDEQHQKMFAKVYGEIMYRILNSWNDRIYLPKNQYIINGVGKLDVKKIVRKDINYGYHNILYKSVDNGKEVYIKHMNIKKHILFMFYCAIVTYLGGRVMLDMLRNVIRYGGYHKEFGLIMVSLLGSITGHFYITNLYSVKPNNIVKLIYTFFKKLNN